MLDSHPPNPLEKHAEIKWQQEAGKRLHKEYTHPKKDLKQELQQEQIKVNPKRVEVLPNPEVAQIGSLKGLYAPGGGQITKKAPTSSQEAGVRTKSARYTVATSSNIEENERNLFQQREKLYGREPTRRKFNLQEEVTAFHKVSNHK